MPPNAVLMHLTIENVGEYIKRLDGCQWLLIGALVPYQTENPTWDPVHGERLSIGGLSPSFGDDDVNLVRRWLQTTRRGVRSGRRLKSGAFRDKTDFCETMVRLIGQCLAEGEEPTQPCIAKYLVRIPRFAPKTATQWLRHTESTARLIRDYCQDFGISWAELVRLAQTPE